MPSRDWEINGDAHASVEGSGEVAKDRNVRSILIKAIPIGLTGIAGIALWIPSSLPSEARLPMTAFATAAILWATTSFDAAFVAMGALLFLTLSGGASQELLFDSLSSDVVWLMIGAFVLGEALQRTGLAARLTELIAARAQTVRGVFWLFATSLIPLTFFIPSTSGRAAIALPICRMIAEVAGDRRIARALSLLVPTVVLTTTISALVGAGSHLIANDLLNQFAGRRISFAQWMLYGLPFGIAAGYVSCWAIMRLFLDDERLNRRFQIPKRENAPPTRSEWTVGFIVLLMAVLWISEGLHGLEIATVTVAGTILLTAPRIGALKWKEGLGAVSWNLVVFVGAALALGRSMNESGASQWIIDRIFALCDAAGLQSRLLILSVLAVISLTSHIYMTSHVARVAVLAPSVLLLADSLNLNPTAALFISVVGMNYCLTFPVSSKALLMFQDSDKETWRPADLLRLSCVLLPIHFTLILLFYYGYWRWIGLEI